MPRTPSALVPIVLAAVVLAASAGAAGSGPLSPVVGEPPQADYAYAPSEFYAGDEVTFTSTSTAALPILVYQWTFETASGTTIAHGPNVIHAFSKAGGHNVSLTVTDAALRTATVTRNIMVQNAPPLATFDVQPNVTHRGVPVTFTDRSSDRDGDDIAERFWDFGDGASASGAKQVEHTYTQLGTYSVVLHVHDHAGNTAAATRIVKVVNAPPIIQRAAVEPEPVHAGERAWFNASAMDPDHPGPVEVTWTFSDGVTLTGASVQRVFATTGDASVTLVAEDAEGGRSQPVLLAFQVHPPPAQG